MRTGRRTQRRTGGSRGVIGYELVEGGSTTGERYAAHRKAKNCRKREGELGGTEKRPKRTVSCGEKK